MLYLALSVLAESFFLDRVFLDTATGLDNLRLLFFPFESVDGEDGTVDGATVLGHVHASSHMGHSVASISTKRTVSSDVFEWAFLLGDECAASTSRGGGGGDAGTEAAVGSFLMLFSFMGWTRMLEGLTRILGAALDTTGERLALTALSTATFILPLPRRLGLLLLLTIVICIDNSRS